MNYAESAWIGGKKVISKNIMELIMISDFFIYYIDHFGSVIFLILHFMES